MSESERYNVNRRSSAPTSPPALSPAGPFDASDRGLPPSPPLRQEFNLAETIVQLREQMAAADRRIEALERARRPRPTRADSVYDPTFPIFPAKLADGSTVQFQQQVMDTGVLVDGDADKSSRCTNDTDPSAIITPDTDVVWLMRMADLDGDANRVTRFLQIVGSGDFFFRLTQTGGSAGDDATRCSYTYSVYAWSDTLKTTALATGVTLFDDGARPQTGEMSAATAGIGFKSSGSYVLILVNEQLQTASCASGLDGGSF